MSCYKKIKAIRLPFPTYIEEKCNNNNCSTYLNNLDTYLKNILGNLYCGYIGENIHCFTTTFTDGDCYLDYILEHKSGFYGKKFKAFGYSTYLNNNDIKLYKPLFDKLNVNYNVNDLRKLVYCYYNGCGCPDYYEVAKNNNLSFELDPNKVEEFLKKSNEKPSQIDKAIERAARHQRSY